MINSQVHPRRSEQVREIIEERIACGIYLPGMRLDESVLVREFGVSRTPIREAILQLASIGLIETRPRRGSVVASISLNRLYEMFEVMAEIEAMCARLAVRRMTSADLEALVEFHRSCGEQEARNDPDEYYRRNEQFHLAIYQASRNGFLSEQAASLHRRLSPYRRLQLRVRNRLNTSYLEHLAIVEAMSAGDGELAAARIREHITIQGERFSDLIAGLARLEIPDAARG